MKFKITDQYSQDIDAVFASFMNPDFVKARSEAVGARNIDVTVSEEDGVYTLTITREMPSDAPGALKKFIPAWSKTTQVETWKGDTGGPYTGTTEANVDGISVSITGSMKLSALSTGSVNVTETLIKVSIPFVGGKMEKFAGSASKEMLAKEYEYNKANIAS
jgi:hypothetical protein